MKRLFRILMALIFALSALPLQTVLYVPQVAEAATTTFAIIGDYGMDDANEAAVATMVNGWNPDYIIATGDDFYNAGAGDTGNKYHESTGKYYCNFLKDVAGIGGTTRAPPARRGEQVLSGARQSRLHRRRDPRPKHLHQLLHVAGNRIY